LWFVIIILFQFGSYIGKLFNFGRWTYDRNRLKVAQIFLQKRGNTNRKAMGKQNLLVCPAASGGARWEWWAF
jgi:hypothetical protein